MLIDSTTWRAARRALDKAIALYIEDPDVAFIDLGFKTRSPQNAGLAVRIHRRCEPSELAIPDLGFPVEVVESNFRFHLRYAMVETASPICQELAGGAAIANEAGRIFTLGGKVRDRRTGEVMLLSCWHVLADAWARGENVLIYPPAVENHPPEMLAEFARSAISRGLDAAVSRLKKSAQLRNEQRGLGAVTGVALPQLGMRVQKSGAGSGMTSGVITGFLGSAMLRYANRQQLVNHLVCITPENPAQKISATGDSGAWWLQSGTQRAAALHFAGGEQPNFALAFSMPEVLEALEVEIDTTIPPVIVAPAPAPPLQPEAPEKIAAAPVAPEPQPVITAVKQVDRPTVETAVIASPVKDVILPADFAVLGMDDSNSEESLRRFIWKMLKSMAQRLAGLPIIPVRRAVYLLAKVLVAAGLVMTMLGFDQRVTTEQALRDEQIVQLNKQLLSITEVARIDSVKKLLARYQELFRIVVIIDRYKPAMNSELKDTIAAEIYAMSQRYHQLKVELICAVITQESKWDPEIVSAAAAMGLMQIIPSTGVAMAQQEGLVWTSTEDILFNPIYNVRMGCRYLASLIEEYGVEGGLAGYNGGPIQAKRYLRKDSALDSQTAFYVQQVMKHYREFQKERRQETMGVVTAVDFPKG